MICGFAAHALQDVEAATAALALRRIGGVGDHLQLAQDEFRNDQHAFEETGFRDIGDAAVDDRAGVNDLGIALARALSGEQPAQRGEVEQVALARAHHQADVGHEQQHGELEQAACMAFGQAVAQDQGKEKGSDDAEQAADHALQAGAAGSGPERAAQRG